MTTFIFNKNKLPAEGNDIRERFIETAIFYGGLKTPFPIYFKHLIDQSLLAQSDFTAISGRFKEEINPLSIALYEAQQDPIEAGDNWQTFLVDHFLENGIEALAVSETPDDVYLSTMLEDHSIFAELSTDRKTLKKLEFKRYLSAEPGAKRRQSSWTKGVFLHRPERPVKFMQAAWLDEEDEIYVASYGDETKALVKKFLQIPLLSGWTEFDYRIGKEGFYKAAGAATVDGQWIIDHFTLLDPVEEDLPLITDRLFRWIRTQWGDHYPTRFWRRVDKTIINPVVDTL